MSTGSLVSTVSSFSQFGLDPAILKSLVAVPAYAAALPLVLVLGQHRFMAILIKLCDHLGRLLALVGIRAIREPYVTE